NWTKLPFISAVSGNMKTKVGYRRVARSISKVAKSIRKLARWTDENGNRKGEL
ncbi:hypothetical protein AVEN_119688-1, partial [Araneus ventricosus]